MMDNKIYVSKENLKKLKEKYPSIFTTIKREIDESEKEFNKNPSKAKFCEYKIYLQSIKQEIKFEYPNKESITDYHDLNKIDKECLELLRKENLFDLITEKELDKKIVKEYGARKAIFLCANGRLVENCQIASYNLLINDEAGCGKDYITSKTLEILPEEIYVKKTRISPAVFTYWHNSEYEPDWTWNGKVFYTEDISESVLNSEVFKVMCSSGSEATIVIKQRAIDLKIEGKPVIITTTANSIPSAELTRRFEMLNLDESINQTQEIMQRHCQYAIKGISPEYNKKYTESMCYLQRVTVQIPFAEKLYLLFPAESVMMRTKFPRFLDFIKASAAFHQFQRKWVGKNTILADKKDYEVACDVMQKIASNKYMVSLTKKQKKIMDFFDKETIKDGSFKVHSSRLRQMLGNFISLPAMATNLSLLTSYGLLKVELNENESTHREIENYYLHENILNGVHSIIFPKFEDLIKKSEVKEVK